MTRTDPRIAIIGSGPAGLMAATEALRAGARVEVFERRRGLGRKLLIAGSSGLNVSHDAPIEEFLQFYRDRDPASALRLEPVLRDYPPEKWLSFLRSLGHEVFVGTSRRWFVREMKASKLLSSWTGSIQQAGGVFHPELELVDFRSESSSGSSGSSSGAPPRPRVLLRAPDGAEQEQEFDAVIFAMGGGSWEDQPPPWPAIFRAHGLAVAPFHPSNVGWEVDFPEAFVREAEGKPLKNCVLRTHLGEKQGELVITRYGIEGTPAYFVGAAGEARLNLRPGVAPEEFLRSLSRPLRENLSPLRRLKKLGGLSEAALALVFHLIPETERKAVHGDLRRLATIVQDFPLTLRAPRPLEEAISSRGGLEWSELDESLLLRRFPGFFAAGEMIDWDAPTGGFLIQASVALGARAGVKSVEYSRRKS